jgi:phosphoglycolate phosphatase
MVKAVLLDLDGTLLDTASDLAAAANAMLAERGLGPLPAREVRDFIGQGIGPLVWRCLNAAAGIAPEEGLFDGALERFGAHYERLNGGAAAVYPGVVEGLERLRAARFRLACVTNKAARFTLPLLEKTELARFFDAVVTSDAAGFRKPHPGLFLHACARLGATPQETVVIGDSANDTQGARAAGCKVLLVPYGYREGRELRDIDCDGVVASLIHAARSLAPTSVRRGGHRQPAMRG